eukprot:SAG31_NODE_1697_length_7503_cov_11.474473_6_plen_74_part_00
MLHLTVDLLGAHFLVECGKTETLAKLKDKICAVADILHADIRTIIFEGQRLEDDTRTLAEYGIAVPTRIYLVS